MNIASNIAYPGGNTGPVIQYQTFRAHVVKAFDLTSGSIENLTPKPGVKYIIDPMVSAVAEANAAVAEIGLALDQDAPTAGRDAVLAAQKLITQGAFEMTHRLNGPLNTDRVISDFTEGQKNLQVALDTLGAAISH